AIEAVGPMDEGFFMFNEDVDWCRRMGLGGGGVLCGPDARAGHQIGARRRRGSHPVLLGRPPGMIRYFHKHHPTHPLLALCADSFILLRAGLMVTANAMKPR